MCEQMIHEVFWHCLTLKDIIWTAGWFWIVCISVKMARVLSVTSIVVIKWLKRVRARLLHLIVKKILRLLCLILHLNIWARGRWNLKPTLSCLASKVRLDSLNVITYHVIKPAHEHITNLFIFRALLSQKLSDLCFAPFFCLAKVLPVSLQVLLLFLYVAAQAPYLQVCFISRARWSLDAIIVIVGRWLTEAATLNLAIKILDGCREGGIFILLKLLTMLLQHSRSLFFTSSIQSVEA